MGYIVAIDRLKANCLTNFHAGDTASIFTMAYIVVTPVSCKRASGWRCELKGAAACIGCRSREDGKGKGPAAAGRRQYFPWHTLSFI